MIYILCLTVGLAGIFLCGGIFLKPTLENEYTNLFLMNVCLIMIFAFLIAPNIAVKIDKDTYKMWGKEYINVTTQEMKKKI